MVGKDDLGLSLSLSFPQNHQKQQQQQQQQHHQPLQFNLMPSLVPSSTTSPSPFFNNLQNPCSSTNNNNNNDVFASSDRGSEICRVETRPFLRGIDVNRAPSTVDIEDEAGVSSPNSTISTLSGKRTERESNGDDNDNDNDNDRSCSRGVSDEEDGDNSRKKLRLSKDQSAILEESFKEHNTLNPKQKLALAKRLGLRPRQVEVWFQNRRARTKLKQTEVDCEYLKRCCETLTEENRRLQKEVQELRALKLSPQFYMQMTPPTTLTMCPSCERVAAPSAGVEAARPIAIAPAHPRPLPINAWAPLGSVAHHAGTAHHTALDALRQRS